MARTLDTLEAKETFITAGFDDEKAKALVSVMAQIDDELARKSDVLLVKAEIKSLESRMANRIYGIGLSVAALVIGMNTLV